jgi:hypothetical protein
VLEAEVKSGKVIALLPSKDDAELEYGGISTEGGQVVVMRK